MQPLGCKTHQRARPKRIGPRSEIALRGPIEGEGTSASPSVFLMDNSATIPVVIQMAIPWLNLGRR